MEAGEVVLGDAVVSGGDATQLLELADSALDSVSQFVFGGVEGAGPGHAGALGDDGNGLAGFDMIEDGVAVIGSVCDDVMCGEAGKQRDGRAVVAGIAAGQNEAYRSAKSVDRDVPLAGQSASGAPQSLVADPPFWPVAA